MQQTNEIEFAWRGSNQQKQPLHGVIKAKNITFAKMQLLRQGIVVRQIRKRWWWHKITLHKRINTQDIWIFTRQLATMLTAGIPLVKALDTIAISTDKIAIRHMLKELKKTIGICTRTRRRTCRRRSTIRGRLTTRRKRRSISRRISART